MKTRIGRKTPLSETQFPILGKCAYQAARRYNNNPSDIDDCYGYILEHLMLNISDSNDVLYVRMKCQSAASSLLDRVIPSPT